MFDPDYPIQFSKICEVMFHDTQLFYGGVHASYQELNTLQDEVKSIQGYDNSQFFDINGPTNTYGSLHPLQHHEHINKNVEPPIHKPQHQPIENHQRESHYLPETVKKEQQLQKERNILSDKEYEEFKDFQRRRYFENHQKKLSQLEGFSNVNDDFNDVLLFGLMGVFFLMFTDYIYKLGKKSY